MATLDFLMVAQCASLVHNVVVGGWELLQFPWVRSYTAHNHDGKMDEVPLSAHVDRLSSLGSDSTSSQSTGGDSSVYYQRYYTLAAQLGITQGIKAPVILTVTRTTYGLMTPLKDSK